MYGRTLRQNGRRSMYEVWRWNISEEDSRSPSLSHQLRASPPVAPLTLVSSGVLSSPSKVKLWNFKRVYVRFNHLPFSPFSLFPSDRLSSVFVNSAVKIFRLIRASPPPWMMSRGAVRPLVTLLALPDLILNSELKRQRGPIPWLCPSALHKPHCCNYCLCSTIEMLQNIVRAYSWVDWKGPVNDGPMRDQKIKERPTRLKNEGPNFQGRKMQDRKMWNRKMQDRKCRGGKCRTGKCGTSFASWIELKKNAKGKGKGKRGFL